MKVSKILSSICSLLSAIFAVLFLFIGLTSLNATGLGRIGIIFILPALISLVIILIDFLITIGKIKNGLFYSCLISLVKLGFIIVLMPSTIYNYNYQQQYGYSNLEFDIYLIVFLIIISIPSIINSIRLFSLRRQIKN